mmetsp:Transcript_6525/g.9684  ORF Transcript_6525/g.9684 Transcript_6525/m.9684 type:complete len:745 (+) Transcript_6525:120-2354(+)
MKSPALPNRPLLAQLLASPLHTTTTTLLLLRHLLAGHPAQPGVQRVDLSLEVLLGLVALELEGGRQQLVAVHCERLGGEVEGLHLFEAEQLGAAGRLLQALAEGGPVLLVAAEGAQVGGRGPAALAGPGRGVLLVRHEDAHQHGLEGVPVDKGLTHEGALGIGHLYLFRGHVLALRQLEHVLLAVHDLQVARGQPDADVARGHPAVVAEGLFGLAFLLVVALEAVGPAELDLPAPAAGQVPVLAVGGQVPHVGHGRQAHLVARERRAHVPGGEVGHVLDGARGGGLRLPVALHHRDAEDAAQEVHDVGGERGRAGDDHAALVQAHLLGDLPEHEAVPERVRELAVGQPPALGGQPRGEQDPLHRASQRAGHDLVVHLVEQAGHGAEDLRPERGEVGRDELDVALVEPDGPAPVQHEGLDVALEHVGEGQVAEVLVAGGDRDAVREGGGHGGDEAPVGEPHALGRPRGAAGVAEGGDVVRPGHPQQLALALADGHELVELVQLQLRLLGRGPLGGGGGRPAEHHGLEVAALGLPRAHVGQPLGRREHGRGLGLVEDVHGGLPAQRVVERHGGARVHEQALLGQHPLGPVLAVQRERLEVVHLGQEPLREQARAEGPGHRIRLGERVPLEGAGPAVRARGPEPQAGLPREGLDRVLEVVEERGHRRRAGDGGHQPLGVGRVAVDRPETGFSAPRHLYRKLLLEAAPAEKPLLEQIEVQPNCDQESQQEIYRVGILCRDFAKKIHQH